MDSIIVFCAQYLIILVGLGWLFAWFRQPKSHKLQFVVATISAGALAFFASRLASKLYYDPRPFVSHHMHPLISHTADNGFPSDHALCTMTLAAITYFYHKGAAAVMFAAAVLVGTARILAHVHSPIDIAGAWAIGILCSAAVAYAAHRLFTLHIRPAAAKKS
jgi:undecaprenyl-diphosphatase